MAINKHDEPENLEDQLDQLERKVDRLRVMFEQYFLGIEKRPPLTLQKEVVRLVRQIGTYHIRKTSLKFRLSSLTQRFNVHRAYWMRTMREIEDGTYRRDRARAERREVARSGERVDAAELAKRALLRGLKGDAAVEARRQRLAENDTGDDHQPYVPAVARRRTRRSRRQRSATEVRGAPSAQIEEALGSADPGAAEQAPPSSAGSASERRPGRRPSLGRPTAEPDAAASPAPPQEPQERRSRPAPSLARRESTRPRSAGGNAAQRVLQDAGLPPDRSRRIYDEWVAARHRAGQSAQRVSYERLVESMARQVPKLRESHGALHVDFEVVTRGDKVFLKPRTK